MCLSVCGRVLEGGLTFSKQMMVDCSASRVLPRYHLKKKKKHTDRDEEETGEGPGGQESKAAKGGRGRWPIPAMWGTREGQQTPAKPAGREGAGSQRRGEGGPHT